MKIHCENAPGVELGPFPRWSIYRNIWDLPIFDAWWQAPSRIPRPAFSIETLTRTCARRAEVAKVSFCGGTGDGLTLRS